VVIAIQHLTNFFAETVIVVRLFESCNCCQSCYVKWN